MTNTNSIGKTVRMLALAGTALASPLLAQTPGSLNQPVSDADIIVTATKQATAVSKVPVSIAVITRDALDQQSIRNPEDLSRITPSLTISNGNSPNGSGVTIRGLASSVGAPTVGIYLDDVNITRRSALGAVTGNGTSFPQLFDIDRVEVLRGPQGTLYGGNSIGGTIKFVLPEPSLNDFRLRAKMEAAVTKEGDPSIEGGVSTAFPLVQDKLGLAVSAYGRHIGGYLDHVSRFTGAVLDGDTNYQNSYSGRVAMLFQASDNFSIKPAFYGSYDRYNDLDQYWTNIAAYNVPAFKIANPPAPGSGTTLTRPGFSTPAYDVFGPYRTGANCNVGENFQNAGLECVQTSPRKAVLLLPSLTLNLQAGSVNFKSITSYTHDKSSGSNNNSFDDPLLFIGAPGTGILGTPFIPTLSQYRNDFLYTNTRKGWTQEFRVSTDTDKAISIVAGGYYAKFKTDSHGEFNTTTHANLISALTGFPVATAIQQYYGVNTLPAAYTRQQNLEEKEIAAFGEVTWKVTDQLRLIGGARFSKTTFGYYEGQFGTTLRRLAATPGAGLTQGVIKEKPISPKAAVQYFIDGRNMVYASATKGFRPGGVTSRPPGNLCDTELAQLGIAPGVAAVPYKSDSVWSYEAGAKLRPFGDVVSIDASVYRVNWNDAQVNYSLLCRGSFVSNAGKVKTTGLDLTTQIQPTDWLTLNGTFAYVDAKYSRLLVTPTTGAPILFYNQGDRQPIPRFTMSVGAQFNKRLGDDRKGYLRVDYQHASGYPRTPGPGTNGFFPDVYWAEATDFVSARIGVEARKLDVSLFVNNLFNAQDTLTQNSNGGRGGCTITSPGNYSNCARYTPYIKETTFRPRTIGITTRFRY